MNSCRKIEEQYKYEISKKKFWNLKELNTKVAGL